MKFTPLHYFVSFLCCMFVGMVMMWESRDKRNVKIEKKNCANDLKYYMESDSIHKANYIELYDTMVVWKHIVKASRKR